MTKPVRRRASLAELYAQAYAWNAANAIGCKVIVTMDDGSEKRTGTRSEAWVMSRHSVMIMVHGVVGGYSLDRVRPA